MFKIQARPDVLEDWSSEIKNANNQFLRELEFHKEQLADFEARKSTMSKSSRESEEYDLQQNKENLASYLINRIDTAFRILTQKEIDADVITKIDILINSIEPDSILEQPLRNARESILQFRSL